MGARGRAAGLALVVAGAVLLALGGPARGGDGARSDATRPASATDGPAGPGRALFVRMGCGGCHMLAAGAGIGSVGPDLDASLPNYDAASLRAKIVDPYPAGPPTGFLAMPQDFGRRMNARQVDELVDFLLATVRH
jgi:mono/diheme cytochrome c family protein